MLVPKLFLKKQVQQYVREVFADTLRNEGFTSYKNEDICWFRVVNHEIVQHVCFVTEWCHVPIMLDISYGFYPLYADVRIPTGSYTYKGVGDYLVNRMVVLLPNITYPKSDYLMCPDDGSYGLTVLTDKVLPEFEGMDNERSCYKRHKDIQGKNLETIFEHYPPDNLVKEMIYNNDVALYPAFLEVLDRTTLEFSSNPNITPSQLDEILLEFNLYRTAIRENRQPFIEELEKKKVAFARKLQKGGIPV